MKKLTVKEVLRLQKALEEMQHYAFDLTTTYKLTIMSKSLDEKATEFYQLRNLMAKEKKAYYIKDLKEAVDYVMVGIEKTYNVPILIDEFVLFNEEIKRLMEVEVEVEVKEFNSKEFEIVSVFADERAKGIKKTVLTPAILKALLPYVVIGEREPAPAKA